MDCDRKTGKKQVLPVFVRIIAVSMALSTVSQAFGHAERTPAERVKTFSSQVKNAIERKDARDLKGEILAFKKGFVCLRESDY